jgi:hypothetical protein
MPPETELLAYFEQLGFPVSRVPGAVSGAGTWIAQMGSDFSGDPIELAYATLDELWTEWIETRGFLAGMELRRQWIRECYLSGPDELKKRIHSWAATGHPPCPELHQVPDDRVPDPADCDAFLLALPVPLERLCILDEDDRDEELREDLHRFIVANERDDLDEKYEERDASGRPIRL